MSGPAAQLLGDRLHLQHGPIDLIIGADGARELAFDAARARFDTVLEELMAEYDLLRQPVTHDTAQPIGETAQRMMHAARRFADVGFVTPMAGVAGAVAETVLAAMVFAANPTRAYVNNGGDVALHLGEGQRFRMAMAGHDGTALGKIEVTHTDPIRGIATSGRHGRSHSLGIADSVTVLAATACAADVAATLIANAVDLPGDPAIRRQPATEINDSSDIGTRLVVTDCGPLSAQSAQAALASGQTRAQKFIDQTHIAGACLFLHGQSCALGHAPVALSQGTPEYA